MKIILALLTVCLYFAPAHAYQEDNRTGETQLTAGEQNSAMHRLSDKSAYAIKQLKKADEFVVRQKSAGTELVVTNLESLLNSEQKDKEEQVMSHISGMVAEKIKNKRSLIIPTDRAVYENLEHSAITQVRDTQLARALRQELREKVR
ncbi:MAG: hypothetical protein IJ218_06825 [Alphaproteobacteria bacterium]|nr:hypothetical protein [Alphaproteobacteria bacterium]